MAKLSELLGNLIGGQTASPMTEEERAMAAAGQNPALSAPTPQPQTFSPMAGVRVPMAGVPTPAPQAPEMTTPPQAPAEQGPALSTPAAGSPQANFERRLAEGGPLDQSEIEKAQQFAQSMGTTFDPTTGYSREPFLQSQEPQLTPPAQGGGLTTQSGIPLSQFLSGEAIPEAGLREEGQLTGRGETLSPDAWAQLSAEREQRALESFGVSGGPDSRDRGDGEMTMEVATRITGGDREAARSLIENQRQSARQGQRTQMTPQEQAEVQKTQAETAKILSSIEQKGNEIGLTEADKARDKKFGAELAQWEISGRANTQANIEALDQIVGGLESGQINTRGWVDSLPFAQDWARAIANPTGQDALDRVRGVVFQSLRETLGAQFTEREGQRFVEASYNPKLDENQNAQRLKDYASRLRSAQEAKNQQLAYLKANGTLQGYTGQDPEKVMLSGLDGEQQQSPIRGDVDIVTAADDILANQ